jgi:hypothetical protein
MFSPALSRRDDSKPLENWNGGGGQQCGRIARHRFSVCRSPARPARASGIRRLLLIVLTLTLFFTGYLPLTGAEVISS